MPNTLAIIQARMGSSRFPGKSLATIAGKPILWYLWRQLSFCRTLDGVILATTDSAKDDPLVEYARSQNWSVFRGSEDDVLDRYYRAAETAGAGPDTGIIRLTGDDILPDPQMVDAVALLYGAMRGRIDHVLTDRQGRLPYGASVELCSFRALGRARAEATEPRHREHVVPYIRSHPELFPSLEMVSSASFASIISLSIDYPEDLHRNEILIAELERRGPQPWRLTDILAVASDLAEFEETPAS